MPTHRHRQRPPLARVAPSGLPRRYALAGCVVPAAALPLVIPGARHWLDTYAGVGALLSLTATVVWGLVSTDSRFLGPRQRLLAQAAHRAATVACLGLLGLHIAVKVAERHATAAEALVPAGPGGRALLIGLGTVAGYPLLLAAATGVLRGAFAARGRPARWRVLHGCGYPAWFAAVVHGLKSGRAAPGWAVACYAVCLVAVSAALAVRATRRGTPAGRRPRGPRKAAPRPHVTPVTFSNPGAPEGGCGGFATARRGPAETTKATRPALLADPDRLRTRGAKGN
ncbi:hypothetical protein [Streptomyces silvisoli]|uniref:Ferric oxidoreductase domain-containing protein n=1 Tax=Streptomyces silvisoli TaxID=3034235 RepID=A0ABT5ZEG8_9ACTN|nr:hypothetical protein [Streptomyces silvisoli]MDF3288229.1 hypothetical protein [Streptomyces silvisoli]